MNYNSRWLNYAVILAIIFLFYYQKTFTGFTKINQDMPIPNAKYTVKLDLAKKDEDRSVVEKVIYSMVDDDIKRKTNPKAYKDKLPQIGKNDLIVLDITSEKELAIAADPKFIGPSMPPLRMMFSMGAHNLDPDWEEQLKGMVLGEIKTISTTTGKYKIQVLDIKKIDK